VPLRDYELVQQAKKAGWVRVSPKWLLTPLDCDPVACQGLCCKELNEETFPQFYPEELARLPKELLKFIETDGRVKLNGNGDCSLIPYCKDNPSIISVSCRLFPLGFSKWGRLIIKKPAWEGRCPFYGKGTIPLYISMRQCLIDVFGEQVWNNTLEYYNLPK